jgi:hypothetical protein
MRLFDNYPRTMTMFSAGRADGAGGASGPQAMPSAASCAGVQSALPASGVHGRSLLAEPSSCCVPVSVPGDWHRHWHRDIVRDKSPQDRHRQATCRQAQTGCLRQAACIPPFKSFVILKLSTCVCFITAGPITKLFAWGGGEWRACGEGGNDR